MRARWAGVDAIIGPKMCYKLVDDESGKIICRSIIRLATKPGTTNLQVNPIKPLRPNAIINTEKDDMLDDFMLLVYFETPISQRDRKT